MKILTGGSEKIVGLGGGSENVYTSKPTHDVIIQIGWFSTQQFNDLCNLAYRYNKCSLSNYFMACVCSRYNVRSDWLIATEL